MRSHLNAFISLASSQTVLSRAESADTLSQSRNVDRRNPYGKLIAVKDNICTTDLPTTAASGILKEFTSPFDATVVKQLRDAGAIVAGKTNMDEFGMGSHSNNSYFGSVQMEDHKGGKRSAGGSSGGSALAVATDQCWV
jgi:aspartyl-tRNA(Asn)/glutamyl-tRNA(Gln) amidotransferase subunit A